MGRRNSPSTAGGLQPVLQAGLRNRRPRGKKTLVRVLVGVLCVVLALALVAGAVLLYAGIKVSGNQERVQVAEKPPNKPMNVLVLGSDSREGLSAEQQESFGDTEVVPGRRADTVMMLHLDEQREKAVLVHFPRDLKVEDPRGRPVKLNSIYSLGPDAMVKTISEFTGMPIHHYVEVDFNGFNRITDTLGGVEVFFERAVRDPDSGLDQPQGCVNIEGDQALAFVRARKIDDDFGRIRRQQLFMRLMVDKIATPGVVLRPDRVISLVNVLSEAVKYDAELSLNDVRAIGLRLRAFNSGNLDMRVVPSAPERFDGTWYVVADEKQTNDLFKALANRAALPDYGRTGVSGIDPEDVRVSILNGTGVSRLAFTEGETLRRKGFQVLETSNTIPHAATAVYYAEGFQDQGRLVADNYGVQLQQLPPTVGAAGQVAVVLGQDFAARSASGASEGAGTGPASPAPPPPNPPPAPGAKPLVHACEQ